MSFTAKIKSVRGSLASSFYKANIEKGAELLKSRNLTGETVEERYEEKRAVARMNPKVTKPFLEAVFSPHKSVSKNWTKKDWIEHVDEFCKRIGIPDDVQLEYYIHRNTPTHHVHISASRLNLIGKNLVNDSFIGKKAEVVCDKMAKSRNLPTAKEIGKIEKSQIKLSIEKCTQQSISWDDFKDKMKEDGYHFELNYNSTGLNGARICSMEDLQHISNSISKDYKLDKSKGYKLSQIDRRLKVAELEKQFLSNKIQLDKLKTITAENDLTTKNRFRR